MCSTGMNSIDLELRMNKDYEDYGNSSLNLVDHFPKLNFGNLAN